VNLKKHLHWLLLIGVLGILSGCDLRRPVADDIAPLAPPAAAENATLAATPAGNQAEQLIASFGTTNPEFDRNSDGKVNILDVAAVEYNLAAVSAPTQAQQSSATILKIEPGSQQLAVGGRTTAEVWAENVQNLAAVDLELRFDPKVLRVLDADSGRDGVQVQAGDFLAANFVVKNEANNDTGVVRYTVTQVAPTAPVNGNGILALIFFEAIAPGTSNVNFSLAQLASGEAQEIAATPTGGQIIVTAAGEATATATTSPAGTPVTGAATATPTFTPILIASPVPLTATPNATAIALAAPPTVQPAEVATGTPTPTPTATPTPQNLIIDKPLVYIPPNATFGQCYRVMPEDTIETIAMFFGTTPQAINLVNDLYPPYQVQRYQTIFVPEFLGNGPNVYQLKPNDSLTKIAAACNLPVTMLARVNELDLGKLPSGADTILQTEQGGLQLLVIPIPPFPPPSRYQYPNSGVIPLIPGQQQPYPIQKNHPLDTENYN